MELHIIGCHGGETPKHRTAAFVVDDRVSLDAGSLTAGLGLEQQAALAACVVSHSHLDHVRDLATLADNRCQLGCGPLVVAGTRKTIGALRKHMFNGVLWPDFARIPSPAEPTLRFVEVDGNGVQIAGYEVSAVPVNHVPGAAALVLRGPRGTVVYSGDTGPTDRLWERIASTPDVRALIMEVSFPNAEQGLAGVTGHHTPRTMATDLRKLGRGADLPTLLFHMKPRYQRSIERECARLKGLNLAVLALDEHYVL